MWEGWGNTDETQREAATFPGTEERKLEKSKTQKRGVQLVRFLLRSVSAHISKEDPRHSCYDERLKDRQQAPGSGRTDRSRELAYAVARMPAGSKTWKGSTGAPLGGMLPGNMSSGQKRGHDISSDNGTSSSILPASHMGAQLRVMRLTGQTIDTGWIEQVLSTHLCVQNVVWPPLFSVLVL